MSTNNSISIKKDGKYKSVYCHWDGYLSHNGVILFKNYKTKESVIELINNGDMSVLQKTIKMCIFYHRDRNEELVLPTWKSKLDLYEYNYVFDIDDNEWYLYEYESYNNNKYYKKIKLIDALILEVDEYKNYKQNERKEKFKRINSKM